MRWMQAACVSWGAPATLAACRFFCLLPSRTPPQPTVLSPPTHPICCSCMIAECEEDAVVGMDSTGLTLHSCLIKGCKGPGMDLSDSARATITGGTIAGCVGGVWAWDSSRAVLNGATVAGGPSHALLVDGAAAVEAQVGSWVLYLAAVCWCVALGAQSGGGPPGAPAWTAACILLPARSCSA